MRHLWLRNTKQDISCFLVSATNPAGSWFIAASHISPSSSSCCRNFTSFCRSPAKYYSSITGWNIHTPFGRTQKLLCRHHSVIPQSKLLPQFLLPVYACDRVTQQRQDFTTLCRQKKFQFSEVTANFQCAAMATTMSTEKDKTECGTNALSPEDEMMRQQVREIFLTAIDSVMPRPMLEKVINRSQNTLIVANRHYTVQRNVFVVGFGKAVLGMARVVDDLLGEHIIKGILSIPTGARADYEKAGKVDMLLSEGSKICVQEGAANNLPDKNAFRAARDIYKLVSNLTHKDIVIVLMSGGGSALLPYPMEPLNMDDVLTTTRELFSHGATIGDVNTVRKHLEVLKGGGLAKAAMPAQVISLIISDVIGDSLDLIASGPTVRQTYSPHRCMEVINRLNAGDAMPEKVMRLLAAKKSQMAVESQLTADPRGGVTESAVDDKIDWSSVQNVLVGTNAVGCAAAANCAEQLGFVSFIISHELSGEAKMVGVLLAKLAQYIFACYRPRTATTTDTNLVQLELEIASHGIKKTKLNEIAAKATRAYNSNKPICIVAGGETIVNMVGEGKGGRNQEMVLAAGIQLQKGFQVLTERKQSADVFFLSGGTDGQDGPTEAAGALVDENFMVDAKKQGLDPQAFLDNNDSYSLWSQFAQGRDLVVTGLTGTNIMDIQLLAVKNAT